MPPKRSESVSLKLSFDEIEALRRLAHDWDIDMSDLLRTCIAIALPVMKDVEFSRRIRLEDNSFMRRAQ